VDAVLGDPANRLHPVAWLGRLLDAGRCRLAGPSSPPRLFVGGTLLTFGVTAAAAAGAAVFGRLAARLGMAGLALEATALKLTLAVRGLAAAGLEVAGHLDRGDLAAARAAVGRHLVSRPTGGLDHAAVASAAIESVAENLTDSVTGPLLGYAAFGLPGAVAYRALNTADAMLGYRDGVLEHVGKAAARLDDAASFVPARASALALVAGAALTGASARAALATARRQHARTSSPNAGWTMAAMAGALGVTLEKPGHYRLDAGRPPTARDIRRAVRVMVAGAGVVALAAAALAAVRRR
jgi:adenosylcobinamide-phosphate synthase